MINLHLDDDTLLHIPFLLGEEEEDKARLFGAIGYGYVGSGGLGLLTFAKDGEASYLGQHPPIT
jgi:hypothetical protein